MGAIVGVGPSRVGCAFTSDPPASFGAAGESPFTDTNGSYVGKAADVAGRGSQAEKKIEKSIKVRVKRKKRIGMGMIVPNSPPHHPTNKNSLTGDYPARLIKQVKKFYPAKLEPRI